MDRDTFIPIAGLVGLALAGGALLYASSGPPRVTTPPGPRVSRSKAPKSEPVKALLHQTPMGERTPAPVDARNVVVVTGCAIRRDFIGVYGDVSGTSPTIDGLANGGVRFDDALASAVSTRPAMGSLFTGRHALDLGLTTADIKPLTASLPDDAVTLAEVLAGQGWYTVAVNTHPITQRSNSHLWQGFDAVRDAHPQGWLPASRLPNRKAAKIGLDLISQRPADRPFFLHLLLTDAHKPIRVPPDEFRPIEEDGHSHAPYRASIQRYDRSVADVLVWLRQNSALENTLVVLLADHGEGLNFPPDHGAAHGRYLSPSAVRVPMIFSGAGVAKGHVVHGLSSNVDVMPTILGLLNVDYSGDIDGRDWSKQVHGEASATDREFAYTDTWYHNANRAAIWTSDTMCQEDFGSQDLDDAFEDACFKRRSDPDHAAPIQAAALSTSLREWRTQHPPASE